VTKPSNPELRDIFDKAAPKYDEITNPYAVARRRDFFLEHAKGNVLEVGAGTGEISRELAKNHKVVATDISPNMVTEIKKKLNIDAIVCDAEHLPFEDASFDTVVAGEVIYYMDHPAQFIREARRVLRPEGRFLLTSANNKTKFYDRIRAMLRKVGLSHMYFDDKIRHFTTVNKLSSQLKNAGFSVLNVYKIMPVPIAAFKTLNKILERTPLRHLGLFIFICAEK
jgi:demethylmenaquinone methyltransferase / 2-methoxy-6-polyprenyl-1,4-benzoquinol methylase